MNTVFIRALRLDAMNGIYKRERTTSQPVEIDLEMELSSMSAFTTGRVADTVDYATVIDRLKQELAAVRFGLVEEMAERIARILIDEFGTPVVRVSVAKLGIVKEASRVGVQIERRASVSTIGGGGEATAAKPSASAFASGSDPFENANNAP